MELSKFVLKSKTVWGGIVMMLPLIARLTGLDLVLSEAELHELEALGMSLIDSFAPLIGFSLVVYGRYKAATPIRMTPGKEKTDA